MEYSKKYRWALAGFIIMLILNLVVLGSIWSLRKQRPASNPNQTELPRLQRFMERELDLSAAQAQKLKTLRAVHIEETRSLQREIRATRRALFREIRNDNTQNQQSLIDSLSSKVGDIQAKLDAAIAMHLAEVRSICNPEQKKKYDRIILRVLQRMDTAR